MKVKIVKCNNQFLWYFNHIGKIFDVVKVESSFYWVREPDEWKCLNFLVKDDVIVIE